MTLHDLKEKLIGEFREKYHYQEGVELLLKSPNHFQVYDATAGIESFISHAIDVACAEMGKDWDMIIAHPPCTYLSNAGAARLYPKKGQHTNNLTD